MKKGTKKVAVKKVTMTRSEKFALSIIDIPNQFQSYLISSFTNKKNFSAFEMSPLQRPISQTNVCNIMKSFKEFGTGGTNIIILKTSAFGKKDQLIQADGQHSIKAAELMKLGLNGRIVKLVDDTEENVIKYIATLNNSREGWSNQVYLSNYGKLKDEKSKPYQLFESLIKKHKLTTTDLSYIFLGGASQREVASIKRCEMVLINERDSMRLLNAVLKVKDALPNKSFARRSLYKVMRMTKNYDKFADKILASKTTFSENETVLYTQLVSIELSKTIMA